MTSNTGLVAHRGGQDQLPVKYSDGTSSRYHERAKVIVRPDEEIAKAAANRPFGDLAFNPEQEELVRQNPAAVQNEIAATAEEFLRNMWPMLEEDQIGFPVSFSLDEADDPQEVTRLEGMLEENRRLGFTSQADQELPKLLRAFSETRGIFRYLRRQHLLLPHNIMKDEELPHFLVTAPVWFVGGRDRFAFDTRSDDPRPDKFVQFMSQRLGTQRLADWYQLWNRRSRPFADYQGDAIPAGIRGLMTQATEIFDYVAIATPYHHVASKEWADPNWQRLIDPYLLGFSKLVPNMFFFLGRWSNTGVFPLASEMTAHTMGYLKEHLGRISMAFNNPYWFTQFDEGNGVRNGADLRNMAEEALRAFDQDNLFAWLTENRPQAKMAV